MSYIEAIILGIVQGLAEFLPISSSGHLTLIERMFNVEGESIVTFNVALHIATLIPVLFIFRKDILELIKKPFSKMGLLIIVGTIPTAVIGLLFNDFFENQFKNPTALGFAFITTGLVLWYAESVRNKKKDIEQVTYKDASIVGVAQGISILPALSRSGFTIAGSLFRGMDREFAFRFSFLLSIPAILGAALKEGYDMIDSGVELGQGIGTVPLLLGMAAASIAGYLAVRFMKRVLLKGNLKVFSYYVFALGILVLTDQMFFGIVFNRIF